MAVSNRTGAKRGDPRPVGLDKMIVVGELGICTDADIVNVTTSPTIAAGTATPTQTRPNASLVLDSTTNNGSLWFRKGSAWMDVITGGLGPAQVWNATGGTLSKGECVYISGWESTQSLDEVTEAENTDLTTRARYVLTADIANGASGVVYPEATVTGLNTSALNVDDIIYLDTGGGYTTTPPSGATVINQSIGMVTVKSATVGVIHFWPGYGKINAIEASDIQGLTSTAAELNLLDGVTGGTVTASLAVVVDASKDISEFRNINAALLTRDSNNLAVTTTTSGTLQIDGVALVDINAGANLDIDVTGNYTMDATGTYSVDAVGASNLTTDSGNLRLSTTTSGNVDITAADDINILASGSDVDINSATLTVDCTGVFSIDGTGASNVTAASGNLTLATTTSGDVIIDSAANVQIAAASGSTIQLQDDADNAKITAWDSSAITTANTRTVTMTDYDLNLTACPVVVSKQVTNVEIAALGAVANGQIAFGAAIPAGAVPCGGWIVRVTDVSGGAIDSATASLGLNGGDEDRYTTAENVFTGAGAGTQFAAGVAFDGTEAKHAEGAITPAVNIVVTTGTADACTAGDMTAYFSYIVPEGV